MNPVRMTARALLASVFVSSGAQVLRNPGPRAEAAKPVIDQIRGFVPQLPQDDKLVVRADAGVKLVFGLMLLLGKFQRLSAIVLAASLVPTTFGGHRFWEQDDEKAKKNHRLHFEKNSAMLGGLLFAALDRKGKPSLGYRASHAGRAATRKTAKHAAKAAKKADELNPVG
jgi:putative oxidoreductase